MVRAVTPGLAEPVITCDDSTVAEKSEVKRSNKQLFSKLANALIGKPEILEKIHDRISEQLFTLDGTLKRAIKAVKTLVAGNGITLEDKESRQNTGGLSITRISTRKDLISVMKSFHGRFNLDGTRNLTGDYGPAYHRIAQSLQGTVEERSLLAASKVVSYALGEENGVKKQGRVADLVKRLPRVGLVVEDLGSLKQSGSRSTFQNRVVRLLRPADLRDNINAAATSKGLLVLPVDPRYSSQRDSRTGAPGIRVADVPFSQLETPWHQGLKAKALKKIKEGKGDAECELVAKSHEYYESLTPGEREKGGYVTLPSKSGPRNTPSNESSRICNGIDADMNAAAMLLWVAALNPSLFHKDRIIFANPQTGLVMSNAKVKDHLLENNYPLDKSEDGKQLFFPPRTFTPNSTSAGRVVPFFPVYSNNLQGEGRIVYLSTSEYFADAKRKVCQHLSKILGQKISNRTRGSPLPLRLAWTSSPGLSEAFNIIRRL